MRGDQNVSSARNTPAPAQTWTHTDRPTLKSQMIAVAMEIRWSVYFLAVVLSAYPVHSHKDLQGLSCVNDYINNVSCVWNSTKVEPGADCRIIGTKKDWKWIGLVPHPRPMVRSCNLKQLDSPGNSVRGCSFVFEDKNFNKYEVMPSIQVECGGVLRDNLTNYRPCDHIKMHPPSAPSVRSSVNETWISWSAGSPQPEYVKDFEFQLQIKHKHQHWKEARTLTLQQNQNLRLPGQSLEPGQHHTRVRVKPPDGYCNAHWSDWSPSAAWVTERDRTQPMDPPESSVSLTSWLLMSGVSLFTLFIVILLVLFRVRTGRSLFKGKPVPDPSKYFHTLNSVHGGNLKTWLSSPSGLEPFFTAQPCDHISPVEVSDFWDVAPSTSPSSISTFTSTTALLHPHPKNSSSGCGSSGDQASSSSSSSSCFSNLGKPLHIDPSPIYFTYQEDNSHSLHLTLCPLLTSSPSYECLRLLGGSHQREPHSPDSGFGIGMEDRADEEEERYRMEEDEEEERYRMEEDEEEVSGGCQDDPLLILSLHHPPPSHLPSLPQVHPINPGLEPPVAVPGGSYVAWPVGGAMGRPSSMTVVEPCIGGYLTLKELQATYSNKSI